MPEAASSRDVVERFLYAAVDPAGRDLADVYAEHVVIEMPFAQPPFPKRSETTRENMRTRFKAGNATREYVRTDNVVIHESHDPDTVIVEYDLHGRQLPSGTPFVLSFIMVITVRDGEIVHSRDYSDPIAAMTALGLLPQLIDSLTATRSDRSAG
jgi:ketosteroid isomerase-like protein